MGGGGADFDGGGFGVEVEIGAKGRKMEWVSMGFVTFVR